MIDRLKSIIAFFLILLSVLSTRGIAQSRREDIHTDFVLWQKRTTLEKDLRERIVGRTFSTPLDSNTEDRYLSACWAISQFLLDGPDVIAGFDKLAVGYRSLDYDTKKAFLEAVYAVEPKRYNRTIATILEQETDPKLFAMGAVYLFRIDTTTSYANTLKIAMVEKFPGYDTIPLLKELETFLSYHPALTKDKTPDISTLIRYAATLHQKTIFSFQRWDRDQPGLALVMNEDGHFVRDAQGCLQIFPQLARSGSDLPYFITNGSTPQGIYSITGTAVSRTNFIGPTPNLQLVMPFEVEWSHYFLRDTLATAAPGFDSLQAYLGLLPPAWRDYKPMLEAWSAGRIGRTGIIAHGTTIDPEFFKDRPFYPLTPTMGCLCAKELWNPTTGHLLVSEQFNLVSAFLSTPARKGYLYVIDVDNRKQPLTRAEVETWIGKW